MISRVLAPAIIGLLVAVAAALWPTEHPTMTTTSGVETLPIPGAFGGESIAFDPAGEGPYVGVSDGRILKWDNMTRRWHDFAFTSANRICHDGSNRLHDHEKVEHTCGRPLGLRFHMTTGNLYIADAYMGLLVVGPNGGLANNVWIQEKEISSFGFTNGLDIDQSNGIIYFTLSSTRYERRNYLAAFITGDNTGRFMKYDIKTKRVSLLVDNLKFPNGVSLSKDGKSILIVESVTCKILRYCLEGNSKNGILETVIELSGFPDNIKMTDKGEYWIGVYSKKTRLSEFVFARPWIGNFIASCPKVMRIAQAILKLKGIGMGFKLSEKGDILEAFEDRSGILKFVSEIEDKEGVLYFGSVVMPFVGVYKDKSKF